MSTGEQKKVKSKRRKRDKSKQDTDTDKTQQRPPVTYSAPNFVPDFNFSYTSMFSQSPYMQGSPPPQFPGAFGFQSTPQVTPQVTPQATPPPWAVKLLDDVNMIKQKFQSIDKIEQTVNLINTKVTDLETKMASLETRLTANEQSCQFISDANEQNKNELKQAKENILNLQTKCTGLQKDTKTLKQEHENFDSKLVNLEARSMRDNLMFYGIPEGGEHEDCEKLVKGLCEKTLGMLRAYELKFDRVHRVGSKSGAKVRPIVAKFHYYEEREYVRKIAFDCSEALKVANQGVGAQLPKSFRDARKPLYPAMKTNDNNSNIDFTDRTNTDDDLDYNFTEMELRQAVFSQKDNKSHGLDCISSEILKTSYDVISPCLLYLYNRMYSSGEYPRSWGEGIITPIFKKGDLNDAGNYRGITLINVLAKIYSQLLLNRLSNWAKIHDKITNNQFGFQKGKSIVDCIFILHSVIPKYLIREKNSTAPLLIMKNVLTE